MNVIDISWPLSQNMTTYKNRGGFDIKSKKELGTDGVRESELSINVHTGTHIDAPSHFLKEGKTIDQTPLAQSVGPCKVLDLTGVENGITDADLSSSEIEAGDILLFKTKNSSFAETDPFNTSFIYLEESGAKYLVQKQVRAIGIDYLGIERSQQGHETHKDLFGASITIIEGLRLGHVEPGSYFLMCLCLALVGCEAAPARALLLPSGIDLG
jgi:arylformamidase